MSPSELVLGFTRRSRLRCLGAVVAVTAAAFCAQVGNAAAELPTSTVNLGSVPLGVPVSAQYAFTASPTYTSFNSPTTLAFLPPEGTPNLSVFSPSPPVCSAKPGTGSSLDSCLDAVRFIAPFPGAYSETYDLVGCKKATCQSQPDDVVTVSGTGVVVSGDTMAATVTAGGRVITVSSVSPCPSEAEDSHVNVELVSSGGERVASASETVPAWGSWVESVILSEPGMSGVYYLVANCSFEYQFPGQEGPVYGINAHYSIVPIALGELSLAPTSYESHCSTSGGSTTCTGTIYYSTSPSMKKPEEAPQEEGGPGGGQALRNGEKAFATADVEGHTKVIATGSVKHHRLRLAYRKLKPGRYKVSLWVMSAHRRILVAHTSMVVNDRSRGTQRVKR